MHAHLIVIYCPIPINWNQYIIKIQINCINGPHANIGDISNSSVHRQDGILSDMHHVDNSLSHSKDS